MLYSLVLSTSLFCVEALTSGNWHFKGFRERVTSLRVNSQTVDGQDAEILNEAVETAYFKTKVSDSNDNDRGQFDSTEIKKQISLYLGLENDQDIEASSATLRKVQELLDTVSLSFFSARDYLESIKFSVGK